MESTHEQSILKKKKKSWRGLSELLGETLFKNSNVFLKKLKKVTTFKKNFKQLSAKSKNQSQV